MLIETTGYDVMSVVQMNNSSNEQYMFKRTIVQTAVVQMRIHLLIWQPNLINIFPHCGLLFFPLKNSFG